MMKDVYDENPEKERKMLTAAVTLQKRKELRPSKEEIADIKMLQHKTNTTAKMSSKRAKTKTTKKRPQRATSNVFAMFDQSQIQEFKEAFNMIDQNRDGFIDKEDLHDMLASLGKNPTDEYLEAMMNEAPGPINFTMFLTMFGEKLNGTDPEDVIRNAFACFDEEGNGM
ncbi:unnamed protein product [Ranitomeya imitator]|uniref:EF-hand domain-containing protein n=1 Tax=Ranitomeya imitator TaxID=111125 RepID=A0ABN9KQ93_9NEOB|nr:unnamed protein product [Ranitomeya imitator]